MQYIQNGEQYRMLSYIHSKFHYGNGGIYLFSILVCTLSSSNSSTHIYKQTRPMNMHVHNNYNKYSGHTYICLAFYILQK